MADLGDVSTSKRVVRKERVMFLVPAMRLSPGTTDVSLAKAPFKASTNYGPAARKKWATPFVVLIEDAVPGENYTLSYGGLPIDTPRRADSGGDLRFYDLDDGTYIAHSAQSASAFEIVVTGTSYVVTQLSGGGSVIIADNMYGGVA